jgi:hypothetical protein
MRKDADKSVSDTSRGSPKRPYAKPKLQEYGTVAKLTQSGGSTKSEGGPLTMGCL